jgi:predicted AAA+ superfamily ATPase
MTSKDVLKQLIRDSQAADLPLPSRRAVVLEQLPPTVRKAFVYIGMRRSGKTWCIYQTMRDLLARGIDRQRMLYMSLADDRLAEFRLEDFQLLLDAFLELHPGLAAQPDVHFFLDEVHEVDGWERFIRRLLDQEKLQVYLSGSSARLLGPEIATQLRGRTIVHEVFPFSYAEYLVHRGVHAGPEPTSSERPLLVNHAQHYLNFGGFPESLDLAPAMHRELLQGYLDTVIYRDIVQRHGVTQVRALHDLLRQCVRNSAGMVSYTKLHHDLKSAGHSIGRHTIDDFMAYLQDAYAVYTVPMYSPSVRRQARNARKVYVADPGIITACTIRPDSDRAARLETALFVHLRRTRKDIFYYRTAEGYEVDFYLPPSPGRNAEPQLVQACVSLELPETRARELRALESTMRETGVKRATIACEPGAAEERVQTGAGEVWIVGAWKWLLQV